MQTTFGLFLLRFWLIFLFLTLEIGTASAEITYSGKITDNPSGWISSTNAYIGYFGTGTVTVNGGDDIISKSGRIGYSGNGEVTIDGLDSSWRMTSNLYAGYMGNGVAGKINITNGASVLNEDASIGYGSDTSGIVEVKGQDSGWQAKDLYVGHEGDGILKINSGAQVKCRYAYTGYYANSSGTIEIDGKDSIFNSDYSVIIGATGAGDLRIQNGAEFSAYNVGVGTGGLGIVNIIGIDSKLICRDGCLSIGRGVKGGIINISNHGLVIADDIETGYYHGFNTEEYGYVNMDSGGTLAFFGDIDDSIQQFLTKVDGDGVIRFWDYGLSDWSFITNATMNEDYFLEYISDMDSELYGYTTLTIIPEPASFIFLTLGGVCLCKGRR
jgi:T5SS/PEP-CTERM-associated repeat protein